MNWLHEAPTNGKSFCKKNGLLWFWCEKCVRYTGHKSTECIKKSKKESKPAYANVARNSTIYTDELESSDHWSASKQETPPPRKKLRKQKRTKKIKRVVLSSSDEESDSDE